MNDYVTTGEKEVKPSLLYESTPQIQTQGSTKADYHFDLRGDQEKQQRWQK